jgi:hypothetical protein
MTHTTKHTPGPLKAVQIIIENSPCTWAVQRKSIREQWGKPSIATYIDNEADARLFAAAPAMYADAKQLCELVRDFMNDNRLYDGQVIQAISNLETALSQAEGRDK